MSDAETTPERHEGPGFSMRGATLAMVALFALVPVGLGVVALMLYTFMGRIALSPPPAPAFPAPTLQFVPTADLAQLRQREQARLHERAAIPIERAMDAIARRGGSAFEPLVAPGTGTAIWPPQASTGAESDAEPGAGQ